MFLDQVYLLFYCGVRKNKKGPYSIEKSATILLNSALNYVIASLYILFYKFLESDTPNFWIMLLPPTLAFLILEAYFENYYLKKKKFNNVVTIYKSLNHKQKYNFGLFSGLIYAFCGALFVVSIMW